MLLKTSSGIWTSLCFGRMISILKNNTYGRYVWWKLSLRSRHWFYIQKLWYCSYLYISDRKISMSTPRTFFWTDKAFKKQFFAKLSMVECFWNFLIWVLPRNEPLSKSWVKFKKIGMKKELKGSDWVHFWWEDRT